jgi:tetratricopeptide (TPR) repeat protein
MSTASPQDPQVLNDLAADLMARHRLHRNPADLDRAVELFRAALGALPPAPTLERSFVLGNLGSALREQYLRERDKAILTEAEAAARQALEPIVPDDPQRPIKLGGLAAVLHTVHETSGRAALLDEEIGLLQEAVRLARSARFAPPFLGGYLANLTTALHTRLSLAPGDADPGELSGQLVETAREAVLVLPADDRGWARCVLAMVLRTRYEITGALVFLWEAADVVRAAVRETPPGRAARPAVLSNAALILRSLREHTGSQAPLVEAIGYLREAVKISSRNEHDRTAYLLNYANALRDLRSFTGETSLLSDALQAAQQAAELAGPGDPRLGTALTGLVAVCLEMVERTGDGTVLTVVEAAGRTAVDLAPRGHRERGQRLANLALVLIQRANRAADGRAGDALLGEALGIAREAVDASVEATDRARSRTNLAALLQMLGERAGELGTLREAVDVAATAQDGLPPGHPFAFSCRANHAIVLHALARHADSEERQAAFAEALEIDRALAADPEAPTLLRILSLRRAAHVLSHALGGSRSKEALATMEAAVELLPQTVATHLPRADREYLLGTLAGLPAQAAAVAVAAGRPERAVELVEHSRGLLVAEALDARGSHCVRARSKPEAREHVEKLDELQLRIEAFERQAGLDLGGPQPDRIAEAAHSRVETETATRRELLAQRASLVEAVRGITGMEDFLRPPKVTDLLGVAEVGHFVYVYADVERCDALAITARTAGADPAVLVIPLPDVNVENLIDHVQALQDAVAAAHTATSAAAQDAAEDEVLNQLAWAWDTIAEPILHHLGIVGTSPDGRVPRVCWCPVGVLAFLPLHAAGHHVAGGDRSVLDRVIPSYASSARALLDALSSPPVAVNQETRPLIVSAPAVEGYPELQGAEAEAQMIESSCCGARTLTYPDRKTVLAALPAHRIAHFACHGEGDPVDPRRGRLILSDDETEPLTVADINRLALHQAALAYLSACHTTVTSPRLADEAVHLTGAFHLAGYRSVVGTLWAANDEVAYDVAEHFYNGFTSQGTTAPDTSAAASALREAVLAIRKAQRYSAPTLWAGYVLHGV